MATVMRQAHLRHQEALPTYQVIVCAQEQLLIMITTTITPLCNYHMTIHPYSE